MMFYSFLKPVRPINSVPTLCASLFYICLSMCLFGLGVLGVGALFFFFFPQPEYILASSKSCSHRGKVSFW